MPPTTPTSRCPKCKRGWTGTVSAHCTVCHCHFSTVKNFDAHVPSRRGCKDPATVTRTKKDGTVVRLLKPVESVFGTTWVSWSEDERYTDGDDQ